MTKPRDPIEIAKAAIEKALTSNKSLSATGPYVKKTHPNGDKTRASQSKVENQHKKTPR